MRERDFGEASDVAVIERVLDVAGLDLVDIGCGAGILTRALARRGARVLGIEPDAEQAASFRAGEPVAGVRLAETGGEALPLADHAVDGVIFSYSLHHVPAENMDAVLGEAIRVLKPGTGFLYVIEPVMAGSYSELTRSFNDESRVRRLAREALARRAAPRFREAEELHYRQAAAYPDFDAFLEERLGKTYNAHRREQIDTPEVRALFAAGRRGEEYRFEQRTRVDYYRTLSVLN